MLHYLGSKYIIGNQLIQSLKNDAPNANTFIDLFCGGGNLLYFATKEPQFKRIYANDYSIALIKTLKHIFTKDFYNEINDFNGRYYKFVTKSKFKFFVKIYNKIMNGDFKGLTNANVCFITILAHAWSFSGSLASYGFSLNKNTRTIYDLFFNGNYKDFCAERPFLTEHLKTFCEKHKEKPLKNYAQYYNKIVEYFTIISIIHGAFEKGILHQPLEWLGGRSVTDLDYSEVLHLKQNLMYCKKDEKVFRETKRLKDINPQYKRICYEKNYLNGYKINFFNGDYIESFNKIKSILITHKIPFENVILYCDPPYINTSVKQYNLKKHPKSGKMTDNHFDYNRFCDFLESAAAEGFNVYYSEYTKLKDNHKNILKLNRKDFSNVSKTELLLKVGENKNKQQKQNFFLT